MENNDDAYSRWCSLLSIASENMRKASINGDGILLEAAAQHPLVDGLSPNEEFSARLDAALARYNEEKRTGNITKIYVPGSRHMMNGIEDSVSLSEAGLNYLVNHGVDPVDIYGESMNEKYKGSAGVYNSSDECYVSSKIFSDCGFSRLVCYCSPAQIARKALSYIQFGVLPEMCSVPCEKMFHNYVDEVFKYIPALINDGSGLQKESTISSKIRGSRKPGK